MGGKREVTRRTLDGHQVTVAAAAAPVRRWLPTALENSYRSGLLMFKSSIFNMMYPFKSMLLFNPGLLSNPAVVLWRVHCPPPSLTHSMGKKEIWFYQVGDMVDYSLIFAVISCSEWGRKPTRVDDDDDETLCVRNVFWGWKDMDEKREPPCQFEQAVGDP